MANILIVDDKPTVRELIKEELASEGYLVETTSKAGMVNEILKF